MKTFIVPLIIALIAPPVFGQGQTVNVAAITAPATGEKTAINTDGVSLATDRGGVLSILYDTNTNGKTTLIAGISSQVIYVRALDIVNDTASSVTVSLGSGTGTNCVTTYTAKTPVYTLDGTSATANHHVFYMPAFGYGAWFKTNSSENLCISTSAGVQLRVIGAADQF